MLPNQEEGPAKGNARFLWGKKKKTRKGRENSLPIVRKGGKRRERIVSKAGER